jgi:4'-phosphopantetheinyl transferase
VSFTVALLDLDLLPEQVVELEALLDDADRERAKAFHFEDHRRRFIARRGLVRIELARAIGGQPGRLRFAQGEQGKLSLSDAPELRFNLSHAEDLALLAISDGAEIGCDIERIDPARARRDVAERFFSPRECATLSALPEEQWVEGFFNCWTRKEAYIKALGIGLSYPLDSFTVSLAPGETARLISGEPGCEIAAIDAGDGYCAAVVTL